MPDFLNGLFFSEILADNAGNGATDVNGVGGANKQDEYIEIQNKTGDAIDLEGYQIWSDQLGLLHTFEEDDEIGPGGTATVVGTFVNPPPGSGFFGANGNNNGASGNGGFLEDGESSKRDTLYLVDPDGNYIVLSYGQPPQTPTSLPTGFPTGGTQQGDGESLNSGAPNGTSILRDANGDLVEGTPTPDTPGNVCFVQGTKITTLNGDTAVERLTPGMKILTKDNGFVTLLAIRRAPLGRGVLRMNPDLRPVVLPAGAVGNTRRLMLSPPHRVLLSDANAELLFGSHEVLVPARHLVGHAGIYQAAATDPVTYFHLLFEQHEVLWSNGCWTESLFLGDATYAALALASGWSMAPGVDVETMQHTQTARPVLKHYETALLCEHLHETAPGARHAA
ncbi:MAG: Hint domain-containing protein [Pseudomonadota bacterium]